MLCCSDPVFFIFSYQGDLEGHLKTLALRHMPPNLQALDQKQTGKYFLIDSENLSDIYYLFVICANMSIIPVTVSYQKFNKG